MNKFDFGIRVEMGEKIGSGHFFRCLSIAEELKKRGNKTIFLTSNKKNFEEHNKKKFPYLILKEKTENEKIEECRKLMDKIGCLIVDLPTKEEEYGKKLEQHNVVIINDTGRIEVFSKILINGSIVKEFHKYTVENKKTEFLLGPKFMILRKEFLEGKKKMKKTAKKIKNVLLVFGGSDDTNITSKILPSILYKEDLKITVVLGPTNKNKQKIKEIVSNQSHTELVINPKNISNLFSKQDLVVSSTGITIYELACLGIPTIMVPVNLSQMKAAREMEKRGFGKILGSSKTDLRKFEHIFSKFEDEKFRQKMSKAGKQIIDGKGVKVISTILERNLKEQKN